MEENYKLEKEYQISPEIFDKAYRSYQKKFVYPKNYIFTALFLILAADFVYAAVKTPENRLVYLLIVVCIALAFREWHNPKFVRKRLCETLKSMGMPVYKIGIGEGFVDISTVEEPEVLDETAAEYDPADIPEETELLPEKTRIAVNSDFKLLEYDEFFLLMQGKSVFYILPKEGFSEAELETVRKIVPADK
ncbi:MAG: YcxB family protein [Ruminococcus flavefaciens]|nr:YcxB family protein [Ruminococcus flavefaciens]MCM1060252.1 YcxB family protein [Eubacterium sp.]